MSYLIDGAFFVWLRKTLAKREAAIVLMVMTALGLTLSLPKCQLLPDVTGKFLGLLVDARHSRFQIPAEKKEYILQIIEACLQRPQISGRHIAKVAVLLLSVKDIVHIAPLYTRLLFRAVAAAMAWDSPIPHLERQFAEEDLQHWKCYLLKQSGKSWLRRANVFHAAGDVSGTGYAGYSSLLPHPIVMSDSLEDWATMQADPHALSSVLRETENTKLVLETIILHRTATMDGGVLIYTGDNQGSIACLSKMMGKGKILDIVRQVHELATAHDVVLEFFWKPRTAEEIQIADSLSRVVDTSDFALNNTVFEQLGRRWGFPTADVFAGAAQKFHKHNTHFTMYYAPSTSGVNGMLQDWNLLKNSRGRLLLWVFPPFHLIGAVIRKSLRYKVDATLVLPAWVGSWTAMLQTLPIRGVQDLPYHRYLFTSGSRQPASMQQSGCPYSLKAYRIVYT